MHSLALYIHIPYCLEKCPYCDFHSIAVERPSIPQEAYANCLVQQLSHDVECLNLHNKSLLSIFFGGGTPSLMSPDFFATVLAQISQKLALQKEIEITVETNPATATQVDFRKWRALGINRISFGAQSFQKELLQKLGRHHSPQEAEEAVKTAQDAGFENVSCDLIFGIEGETQKMLEKDLEKVVSLNIPHISAYQLTVETGTPLAAWVQSGQFQIPQEEDLAAMHTQVSDTLENRGWHRYEISNYSKPGFESQHNLQYWRYRDFLGIGSGATSFVKGKRWRTTRKLKDYISPSPFPLPSREGGKVIFPFPSREGDKVVFPPPLEGGGGGRGPINIYEEEETIDFKTAWKEKWMMGLRLSEGVIPTPEESQLWKTHFSKWAEEGWIKPTQDRIQLTSKGFLFCNRMVQNVFALIDEL